MPLEALFTWRQTASSIIVDVPLKGASAKALDIVATSSFVKVAFDRYLLLLDLLHGIDDTACVAKIKHGTLVLKLQKADAVQWPTLQVEGKTKKELKARRAASIEAKSDRDEELSERAKDRKVEDDRKALRKQMSLEEDERCHIDDLKAEEKRSAEASVYRTLAEIEEAKASTPAPRAAAPRPAPKPASLSSGDGPDNDELPMKEMLESPPAPAAAGEPGKIGKKAMTPDEMLAAFDEEERQEAAAAAVAKEAAAAAKLQAEAKVEAEYEIVEHEGGELDDVVPDPRVGGVVKFNFTPRIFPTPMRESKATEEEDWIAKNRSHLRHNPQLRPQLDAMDIEDSDPTWLKGKGDDFYRARDYRAAVNAYTTALELCPGLMPVMSNRGACYLQLGDLVHCVEDCDALLLALDGEAMGVDANPADMGQLGMRLKALARRGAARCQQGRYADALGDYQRAVSLSPGDAGMVADLRRVFRLAKCAEHKTQADALLAAGRLEEAREAYTSALETEPTFVSALSNRAACLLALGLPEGCAADCTVALELLAVNPEEQAASDHNVLAALGAPAVGKARHAALPSGPVPPVGSSKRRTWVLKTVARRGKALAELGRIREAVGDFEMACSLAPDDADLARDLEALRSMLPAMLAAEATPDRTAGIAGAAALPPPAPSAAEPPAPPPPPVAAQAPADTSPGHSDAESQAPAVAVEAVPGLKSTRSTLVRGWGAVVKKGSKVTVHAEGALLETGAPFWNTRSGQGVPFQYTAGQGAVIRGWDSGCLGMCVGERRQLDIPASEGYGAKGFPAWGIPGGATLRFTLDCIAVE